MNKFEWIVLTIVFFVLLIVAEIMLTEPKNFIKIDCQVAEISPDISKEVKDLCRKLRNK